MQSLTALVSFHASDERRDHDKKIYIKLLCENYRGREQEFDLENRRELD